MHDSRLGSLVAAAGIAVGALTMTPVAADAKPIREETIKKECKEAGGTYTHEGSWSGCQYRDIDGNTHLDEYINGNYLEPK